MHHGLIPWPRPDLPGARRLAAASGKALRTLAASFTQPADPNDPTIVAILSKLTGDIDPAKVLQFAPAS